MFCTHYENKLIAKVNRNSGGHSLHLQFGTTLKEASGDALTDVREIPRCAENSRQTNVFVAEISPTTMTPTNPSVAQFIQKILSSNDNVPKEATDDDDSVRILVDVIVHQEDEGAEAQQEEPF